MINLDELERLAKAATSGLPGDRIPFAIHALDPEGILELVAEVRRLRDAIRLQANAVRTAMDANTRASSIRLELAEQARAESSPEVLASERAMNAMLTEENEALREDAERWRTEMALRNDPAIAIMFAGTDNRCAIYRHGELYAAGETYAASIDAARAKESK
jgi:hypothetical protein